MQKKHKIILAQSRKINYSFPVSNNNTNNMTDTQKKLEKFEKDFAALLKKHPDISVGGDINGDPVASCFDGIKTTRIKLINAG